MTMLNRQAKILVTSLLGLVLVGCAQARIEANFVPASDSWALWEAHDPDAGRTVDHGAWEDFLGRYVRAGEDGLNRVAYKSVTAPDRQALNAYIAGLEATPISGFNRREQFAYWVNLYNAVTIQTVLDHYPVDSIRDINDGFL